MLSSFTLNVIRDFADSGKFFQRSQTTFLIPDSYAYYLFIFLSTRLFRSLLNERIFELVTNILKEAVYCSQIH